MLRVRFVRPCALAVLGTIAPSGLLGGCLLALLLSGAACKKSEPSPVAPRVTRIRVVGLQEGVDPESDPRLGPLIDAAGRGLRQAGVQVQLQPPAPQVADFHLRLQLQVQTTPLPGTGTGTGTGASARPTGLHLRLLCVGELSVPSSGLQSEPEGRAGQAPVLELSKFDHVGMMEKDLPGEPAAPDVLALLLRLVEDSTATMGGELALLRSDSRELMARVAKSDGDPALRGTAIQILGRRKERLAIPVLTALIKETGSRRRERLLAKRGPVGAGGDAKGSDAAPLARQEAEKAQEDQILSVLRDTAIGALIEIGDRSAVRPLLDSVAFLDRVEMGKIVEAVATLGGDEARNYLRFVAGSHPEPAIREAAAAALKRLERREGEPSKPPAP